MAEEHTFSGVAGTIMGTEDMMSPKVFNRSEARTHIHTKGICLIFISFSMSQASRTLARTLARSRTHARRNERTHAHTYAHERHAHTHVYPFFGCVDISASGSISSILKIAGVWVGTVPQNYAQTE